VRRTYLGAGALALVAALVVAGCGGGGSSSSASTSSGGGESETTGTATESGGTTNGTTTTEVTAEAEEEAAAGAKEAETSTGGTTTAAVVKVTNTPDLGKVIVGPGGMTLYDFHKDKGTTSSCYGACAAAWPPLLTKGAPKATGGAESSLLGTTKRKDGTVQVTYNGHPLYGFVEDKEPGEANGNDVSASGAEWYALEPNGEEPEDS
jgi:predicted lipoprotein with Yx(FWY)xxD motif